MYFLITGHVTDSTEIGRYREEEDRVLAELRAQGVVREAFSPVAGHGVIGILEGPSLRMCRPTWPACRSSRTDC